MDIQFIREFISVAQSGNLPQAADLNYISPSLLSLHIRKIEDELGYPLFDRTPRTLVLNDRGRLFLSYAKKIISSYDEYLNHAAKAQGNRYSQLHIGLIGSVAQTTTENLIADFYKDNSDIKLYIKSRDYPQMLTNFLTCGQCDFVFLYDADPHIEGVTTVPLFMDRIVAVVPPEHRLSGRKHITVRDLRSENILMQNSDAKVYKKIISYSEKQGVTLNISFAVNSQSLMEEMLEINAGVGLMTLTSAERLRNKNLSFLTVEPELTMEFSMLYVNRSDLTAAQKRFLQFFLRRFDKPQLADCLNP